MVSSEQSQDGVSVSELWGIRTDKLSALKIWSFWFPERMGGTYLIRTIDQ